MNGQYLVFSLAVVLMITNLLGATFTIWRRTTSEARQPLSSPLTTYRDPVSHVLLRFLRPAQVLLSHLALAVLGLVGVWATERALERLFPDQQLMFFDLYPARWFFDASEAGILVVLLVFGVFETIRELRAANPTLASPTHSTNTQPSILAKGLHRQLMRLGAYSAAVIPTAAVAACALFAYVWSR
jgi:hypothetical protein